MNMNFISIEDIVTRKLSRLCMERNYDSPIDADPDMLWAHLKSKYREGDSLVDSNSNIWDVWRKGTGYFLYCQETKEIVDVPRPDYMGKD